MGDSGFASLRRTVTSEHHGRATTSASEARAQEGWNWIPAHLFKRLGGELDFQARPHLVHRRATQQFLWESCLLGPGRVPSSHSVRCVSSPAAGNSHEQKTVSSALCQRFPCAISSRELAAEGSLMPMGPPCWTARLPSAIEPPIAGGADGVLQGAGRLKAGRGRSREMRISTNSGGSWPRDASTASTALTNWSVAVPQPQ